MFLQVLGVQGKRFSVSVQDLGFWLEDPPDLDLLLLVQNPLFRVEGRQSKIRSHGFRVEG